MKEGACGRHACWLGDLAGIGTGRRLPSPYHHDIIRQAVSLSAVVGCLQMALRSGTIFWMLVSMSDLPLLIIAAPKHLLPEIGSRLDVMRGKKSRVADAHPAAAARPSCICEPVSALQL